MHAFCGELIFPLPLSLFSLLLLNTILEFIQLNVLRVESECRLNKLKSHQYIMSISILNESLTHKLSIPLRSDNYTK